MNNRDLDNYITGYWGEDQFKSDPDFDSWMQSVDAAVKRMAGCSVYDLPDCTFADWFDDGVCPVWAAIAAIEAAKE